MGSRRLLILSPIFLALAVLAALPVGAEPVSEAGCIPGLTDQPSEFITAQYQGCCSWHSGVCGCYGVRIMCCDGTLSRSCTCNSNAIEGDLVVLRDEEMAARGGGRSGGTHSGSSVNVHGYTRKDGTYVAPHQRSAPDGNPKNNYDRPGNYNPNKGTITPGDPEKYDQRYYERQQQR